MEISEEYRLEQAAKLEEEMNVLRSQMDELQKRYDDLKRQYDSKRGDREMWLSPIRRRFVAIQYEIFDQDGDTYDHIQLLGRVTSQEAEEIAKVKLPGYDRICPVSLELYQKLELYYLSDIEADETHFPKIRAALLEQNNEICQQISEMDLSCLSGGDNDEFLFGYDTIVTD